MSPRRYNGYHGRTPVRDALKLILCLMVLALALTVAGLIFGQRYLVYTDDGVRLELPFLQREQTLPADRSAPVDVVQLPESPLSRPEAAGSADAVGEELINEAIQE